MTMHGMVEIIWCIGAVLATLVDRCFVATYVGYQRRGPLARGQRLMALYACMYCQWPDGGA
jgi:hypothetical protein